jgi:hypothetical protein
LNGTAYERVMEKKREHLLPFFSHHPMITGAIQALPAFSTGLAYMARQMALCSSGTSD